MCVKFVCVKFVCVKLLYVKFVCVLFVCVLLRRRREEEKPGIQNQKQEPHTKMWGKTMGFSWFWVLGRGPERKTGHLDGLGVNIGPNSAKMWATWVNIRLR